MMNPVAGEVPESPELGKNLEGKCLLTVLRASDPCEQRSLSQGSLEMFSALLGKHP